MKRVVLAALVLAAAGMFAFTAPADAHTDFVVGVTNYAYKTGNCPTPPGGNSVAAEPGDSVTWTNCESSTDSPNTHSVTANDGSFEYVLGPGVSSPPVTISHTIEYHCKFHSSMTGKISVAAATSTTTATTQKPTTTTTQPPATTTTKRTTSTVPASTTTTGDINGVFDGSPSPTESSTTLFTTDTTRALGEGGGGSSAGVVAALIVGLGAVGTAAALIIRRMRAGASPP